MERNIIWSKTRYLPKEEHRRDLKKAWPLQPLPDLWQFCTIYHLVITPSALSGWTPNTTWLFRPVIFITPPITTIDRDTQSNPLWKTAFISLLSHFGSLLSNRLMFVLLGSPAMNDIPSAISFPIKREKYLSQRSPTPIRGSTRTVYRNLAYRHTSSNSNDFSAFPLKLSHASVSDV